MNILVTGGTGLIGSSVCKRLLKDKHHIVLLSRHPETINPPLSGISDLRKLNGNTSFDIVINLAGEPIADKRWSKQQKQLILSSRLEITQQLINYFKTAKKKPELFISGSAIGFYGIEETESGIDETMSGDDSFSSQLCRQWEATALQAETLGIRTCLIRTGIVLGPGGGALSKMLLPFKLGFGGRIGKGKQWMSWIHLDDLVGIILYCIEHDSLHGAINGTSPYPVSNKKFTQVLAKVLNRPALLPMPAAVVTLLMGQMGRELLLAGKKVLPVKVSDAGYKFKYEHLEEALTGVLL